MELVQSTQTFSKQSIRKPNESIAQKGQYAIDRQEKNNTVQPIEL